jgi:hypothetical protein
MFLLHRRLPEGVDSGKGTKIPGKKVASAEPSRALDSLLIASSGRVGGCDFENPLRRRSSVFSELSPNFLRTFSELSPNFSPNVSPNFSPNFSRFCCGV